MDTNKLFERYMSLDRWAKDMLFVRLFGRMEKSNNNSDFFKELDELLQIFGAEKKEA